MSEEVYVGGMATENVKIDVKDLKDIEIKRKSTSKEIYEIAIPLSKSVNRVWGKFLDQGYHNSIYKHKRPITISGNILNSETEPDHIGEHIKWLGKLIEDTNKRAREHNEKLGIEKKKAREEKRKEEEKIRFMKEKVLNYISTSLPKKES